MLKLCLDAIIFLSDPLKNLSVKLFLMAVRVAVWWIGSYLALSGDISSSRGTKMAEQRL